MQRARLLLATALLTAATATVAGTTAASATTKARCAPSTDRTITGTLVGTDHRALDAMIGFDLEDTHRNKYDAVTGCPTQAYGALVRLNSGAPATGLAPGTGQTTFTVSHIPADVKVVYAEVYLRDQTGASTRTHYGWTVRQNVALGRTGVHLSLVAPLLSETGQIRITTSKPVGQILAFSEEQIGATRSPGWAISVPLNSSGRAFVLPALTAGQRYIMVVGGHEVKDVKVLRGRTTALHVNV